ncbi:MAG: hypothetical protein ACYC1D_09000 [Acidimicrobiales bacterium]
MWRSDGSRPRRATGQARLGVSARTGDFDYPVDVLDPLKIEFIHPDDFLLDQLDLAPRVVLDVLREQADHTRRPALSPVDLIARLARAGAPAFADEAGRLI